MAFPSTCIAEVRATATAADANGGVWDTAAVGTGTDYSQQDAAQYNLTGGTSSGAGSVILHASASVDMTGNGLRLVSGTNATAGWYVIISVVAGVSITVDRACTTGVGASIVFNIGGAWSLASANDQTVIQAFAVAGNKMWIKNGTYALTGTMNASGKDGTNTQNIVIEGYNATRGDLPKGATRPLISGGSWLIGQRWTHKNISFTSTVAGAYQFGTACTFIDCKFVCTAAAASLYAILIGNYSAMWKCEVVSYRNSGVRHGGGLHLYFCYIHDCTIGIENTNSAGTYPYSYVNNIIENCTVAAISFTTSTNTPAMIVGNTLYGSENKLGIGVSVATTAGMIKILGNIIYGFTSGITLADATGAALATNFQSDYNTFFNNTSDVTNIVKGPSDIALTPSFTSVTQLTGATATTSGSVLTQSGADFSNVVDNQDVVYLVSGTGVTTGIYMITGHTTTTLTLHAAPGTSAVADKVWQITLGHNFSVGTNMKGAGPVGAFPGALNTGYQDIGAVQRIEAGSGFPRGRIVNA